MIRTIFALVLAVTMFCSLPVRAQDTSPSEKSQTDDEAVRAKAFALLESLAGEIGTLQSAENRARIGSNIAGSLWPHNERRARELFALVQQDISANLQVPEHPSAESNQTLLVFLNLRSDTVQRIAKHDPELAHSFFKATEPDKERLPYTVRNIQDDLELYLARQIAATNPDIAVELSLKSTTDGFPQDLRSVIRQLNRKHKDQANVLYKALVRKLRDTDLSLNYNARAFAISLVNSITPPAIDEASFRELVGLFIRMATTNQCAQRTTAAEYDIQQNCMAVGGAIEQIAKIDPLRASRLKHWATESFYERPPPPGIRELWDLAQDGTVDEILALAAHYPALKNEVLRHAANKARRDGDYERARKLLSELDDPSGRHKHLLDQLDREQGRRAFDNEKFGATRKRIAELPRLIDRIRFSIALANETSARDRAAAFKLLEEAGEMLDTMKPGVAQAQARLMLATIYCLEGSDRGLKIMEAMIPVLNELVQAAGKLDGYDTGYLREGEWNMSANGPLGKLLTELSNNAAYFAWSDLDKANDMARQFEKPEIRMMAQLKLAQGILAGRPKRMQLQGLF